MSGTPPHACSRTTTPQRRWTRAALLGVLGIAVGLVAAELVFRARSDGAFPHLNLYVADPELGVRLAPNSSMRFRFRDNPATEIRVNADGYRGPDWPAPGGAEAGEVIVLGDSQVFGLGVEADEAFAAQLSALLGRPVRNAGVPTYGPLEMEQVARELLVARRPSVVVYTVNMVNDLFEAERPNVERHAVWDGWAVRRETMPDEVFEFPGRRWLMSRSHLVYALRRALAPGAPTPGEGFESEGVFADLVHIGESATREHQARETSAEETRAQRRARLAAIATELEEAERVIDLAARVADPHLREEQDTLLRVARNHPGDIVEEEYEESSRRIAVTAAMIRRGAALRERLVQRIPGARGAGFEYAREALAQAQAALPRRAAYEEERARLEATAPPDVFVPSVLAPALRSMLELTRAHGAELIVVVLPMDVQVSPDEWQKYGQEPLDMEPTLVLNRDIVATAERMGVRAVDLLPALRAVPTTRFLDHDIHMTPASHRAAAEAIAAALAEPAPVQPPTPGLGARSRLPSRAEWSQTAEATVRGSTAARCETVRVREWLRVTCFAQPLGAPLEVQVVASGGNEWIANRTPASVTWIVALLEHEPIRATFRWTGGTQDLVATWPEGAEEPFVAFEPPVLVPVGTEPAEPPELSQAEARLCRCWVRLYGEQQCRTNTYGDATRCEPSCRYAFGATGPGCHDGYADESEGENSGEDAEENEGACEAYVACASGDPDFPPSCPMGWAVAGGAGQCRRLCDADHPCDADTRCVAYQGTGVCL